MTDIVWFIGIVAVVAVVGLRVGMIAAGRIDGVLAARAETADEEGVVLVDPAADQPPASPADTQEEPRT